MKKIKSNQDNLPYRLLFEGVVGSTSFRLNTPESDIDIKGVYIQDIDDILSNKYEPHIKYDDDTTYYELRRFLELLNNSTPEALELLNTDPEFYIVSSGGWNHLYSLRKAFITKNCINSFSKYALTQLRKHKNKSKMSNWDENDKKRKTIVDFCNIIDVSSGNVYPAREFSNLYNIDVNNFGLTKVDGFRDTFKVYLNQTNARGIGDEYKVNEPRLSIIPIDDIKHYSGILYFNREEYSQHCKRFNKYDKWLKNRNQARLNVDQNTGNKIDSKNLMHNLRLIQTAYHIADFGTLKTDYSDMRDFLLDVKKGRNGVDLQGLIDQAEKDIQKLEIKFKTSNLPDKIEININDLELVIRKLMKY